LKRSKTFLVRLSTNDYHRCVQFRPLAFVRERWFSLWLFLRLGHHVTRTARTQDRSSSAPIPLLWPSVLGGLPVRHSCPLSLLIQRRRGPLIAQTLDANRWPECSVCQEDQHIKKKKRQNRSSSERHLHPHCLFLRQLMAKLAWIIHHRPCNIMREGWRDLPIKVQERGQQVNTVSSFLCRVCWRVRE
jgi:hypothetical protein